MSSFRWSRVCGQKMAFPSCCGNVVVWTSACEDTERRESGLSYTPPPGQTGQGDITAYTHTILDVWENGISLDALTLTHAPRITPVSYLQSQLHLTEIGFLRSLEWASGTAPPICIVYKLSVESNNHLFFVKECSSLTKSFDSYVQTTSHFWHCFMYLWKK